MTREEQAAAMKAEVLRKKTVARQVLSTEAGKEFLRILKQEFFHKRLAGKSPEEMAFNLGACDVIAYIEQLNEGK